MIERHDRMGPRQRLEVVREIFLGAAETVDEDEARPLAVDRDFDERAVRGLKFEMQLLRRFSRRPV